MPICKAEQGDKHEIALLIKENTSEHNIYSNSKVNPSKLIRSLDLHIDATSEIILVHKGRDKEIDGVIIGTVFDLVWSDTIISSQQMLFVQKDKRGSSIAYKLVRAYINKSKELGAKVIEMGNIIEDNIETSCDFFNRLGFNQVGTIHHMEI